MGNDKILRLDEFGMLGIHANSVIGQSIAILGIKGSGKSNTAAVLMEESQYWGLPIAVVDIAGEYYTIADKFDTVEVIGRSVRTEVSVDVHPGNAEQVAELLYMNGRSFVLDISGHNDDVRVQLLTRFFRKVYELSVTARIPQLIFLEEAHNWIPQSGKSATKELFVKIANEARKYGLSVVMIGTRSARMSKDVLTQADLCFLHKVRHPTDLKVYMQMIPREPKWVRTNVNALKIGEAIVMFGEKILKAKIRKRITKDVGATPTMANIPTAKQMTLLDLLVAKNGNVEESSS